MLDISVWRCDIHTLVSSVIDLLFVCTATAVRVHVLAGSGIGLLFMFTAIGERSFVCSQCSRYSSRFPYTSIIL
jgi:hypothetical protein